MSWIVEQYLYAYIVAPSAASCYFARNNNNFGLGFFFFMFWISCHFIGIGILLIGFMFWQVGISSIIIYFLWIGPFIFLFQRAVISFIIIIFLWIAPFFFLFQQAVVSFRITLSFDLSMCESSPHSNLILHPLVHSQYITVAYIIYHCDTQVAITGC